MTTSQHADPLIGRLVDGRYRVRARIARGGMATVYLATDLRLERRIALKVMHGHLSDDSVFQSRFIQEARAAARLADPHVVNVFDQGQDGELAYLVMEYLPGITLRELIREQKRLSIVQTITIMDAVLSGLAAAHRAGIVHRDVKPENVLLAEDGRIKIGDFGLARATTANTASGAQLLGTIAYLAPELVTRGTADARSDIYSLGIMLYEMLVGEQPYKGEQPMQIAYQHATDSVPRPSIKNPGVPEQLDELVLWATERSPEDRPDDAQQMLDRLREIEDDLDVRPLVARATDTHGIPTLADGGSGELTKVLPGTLGTGVVTPVAEVDNGARLRRRTQQRTRRGGWLFVLVIVLAALAGGAGWWFGTGPGSMVAVPDVTGLSFADAEAHLREESLVAVEATEYHLEVAAGETIRTDPSAGKHVDKDATVTVYISLGPQPVVIEPLQGMDAAAARGILEGAVITVDEDDRLFSADIGDGGVIAASVIPREGGDPIDCTHGCEARQGDAAHLTVSVGAVPDVAGLSITEATTTLAARQLLVTPDPVQEHSETVEEGRVIGLVPVDGALRPDDTVTLIVSLGPPLFPIPDLVGLTLADARTTAREAGFALEYDARWDVFPDPFTRVESQSPGAGAQRPHGTTISVRIAAAL